VFIVNANPTLDRDAEARKYKVHRHGMIRISNRLYNRFKPSVWSKEVSEAQGDPSASVSAIFPTVSPGSIAYANTDKMRPVRKSNYRSLFERPSRLNIQQLKLKWGEQRWGQTNFYYRRSDDHRMELRGLPEPAVEYGVSTAEERKAHPSKNGLRGRRAIL